MRTTKILLTILFCLSLHSFDSSFHQETLVYICKGKGSKKYHFSSSCRGLSRCSTKIFKVTLQKARAMGRTLCGWED